MDNDPKRSTAYSVTCPRCDTRIVVPTSDAGREVRCEMCHGMFTAPTIEVRREPESKRGRRFSDYGVEGKPAGSQAQAQSQPKPREFPVECSLCGTRMHFREEHVGRKARCPDCYTVLVIPEPPPLPESRQITQESYGVSSEEPPPRPDPQPLNPAAHPGYSFIPRPGDGGPLFSDDEVDEFLTDKRPPKEHEHSARQPAAAASESSSSSHDRSLSSGRHSWHSFPDEDPMLRDDAASRWKHEVAPPVKPKVDPHPHTKKPARQPARPQGAPKKGAGKIGGPGKGTLDKGTGHKSKSRRASKNSVKVAKRRARESMGIDLRDNPLADPPRLPMLSGIYSTPFRTETLYRYILLIIQLMMLVALGAFTLFIISIIGRYGIFFIFGCGFIACLVGGYAAGMVQAIVMDTANGAKEITGWPDWDAREWPFMFIKFLFPAMLAAGVAHFPAAAIATAFDLPYHYVSPALTMLLLPIPYLSGIVESHAMAIYSGFVMKSFVRVPHAWFSFYFQTSVMFAAAVAVFELGMRVSLIGTLAGLCPLLAAFIFFWARLAGRLLWMAGQKELAAQADK